MTTNLTPQCAATTKSGQPCRNKARPGSSYCATHQTLAAPDNAGETAPAVAEPTPEDSRAQLDALMAQLNGIAADIQKEAPTFTPPPFSPSALIALVRDNIERFAPGVRLEIVDELRRNLQGTSPKDLLDPETWKGLWYVLNYTARGQVQQLSDGVLERLMKLPGMAVLSDLKSGLEGASPKDFLDIDTWKGAWIILNAAVQAQVSEVKRRVLGSSDDEDQ